MQARLVISTTQTRLTAPLNSHTCPGAIPRRPCHGVRARSASPATTATQQMCVIVRRRPTTTTAIAQLRPINTGPGMFCG
jgi:hypothetical protein